MKHVRVVFFFPVTKEKSSIQREGVLGKMFCVEMRKIKNVNPSLKERYML